MNILMLHPHDLWYDPWTIRILALARELQNRGHTVTLCHMPRKDKPDHQPLRQPQANDPPVYELLPRQHQFLKNLVLLKQLAVQSDILHLQKCFPAASLPLLWISRWLNKPLHYDWDDNESALTRIVEPRRFTRIHINAYERQLPHFASTITCASQSLIEKALQRGFDPERIRHLPVGADIQRFSSEIDGNKEKQRLQLDFSKRTVLYIGQMEGASHARRLIESAPLVIQAYPQVQFVLVGGGRELSKIKQLAAQSPVSNAIIITGYLEADRIPYVVASADVCVACFDDDEATRCKSPLKIAEYLASGKAIVANNVGDVPYMVQDCGVTVEPGNINALAEAIVIYLLNPQKREQDGHRARKRAIDVFNWQRGAEILLEAYRLIQTNSRHTCCSS